MRVAFYAPLKPPGHPLPSGDRRMARLLIAALAQAGFAVELASSFRSFDGDGDPLRQQRLAATGARLAARLIRRFRRREAPERPALWFTYHLYHKAPDHLGPAAAAALAIPYVIAEASFAPKRAGGPWDLGHRAAARAIAAADLVLGLNPADGPCVRPLLKAGARLEPFAPFLDTAPWRAAAADRDSHRRTLAALWNLDPAVPWLVAVAMMRDGAKLASYRLLAAALARLGDRRWRLIVAGDGPAEALVQAAFAPLAGPVVFAGRLDEAALCRVYAAADLCVWPAVDEAYGMALLEAQAAGLAVVAGRAGGVAGIVADGETGRLVPVGDVDAFAAAVASLLDDPATRRAMADRAAVRAAAGHDLAAAAERLRSLLTRTAARVTNAVST